MKSEGDFQKELRDAFKASGAVVLNKWGNAMEGSGWPDMFIWHRVYTGLLELKVNRCKYTDKQVQKIKSLRFVGTSAYGLRYITETKMMQLEIPDTENRAIVVGIRQFPLVDVGQDLLKWLKAHTVLSGIERLRN